MGYIIMSTKEKKQVKVLEQLIRKELTQQGAAELLDLTDRQVRTKLKAYRSEGITSLMHKNRGKRSNRRWNIAEEEFAIGLLKGDVWYDFGPTFAAEKLEELYGIIVSDETLRKRMIQHGVWTPHSPKAKRRKRRERKRMFGTMIQLDGSPHRWFGKDGIMYTLLVFIDDATSEIVHLEFVKSESLESVMLATRRYIENHGRPRSFYVDFASVFSVNTNNPDREKLSQWERAMEELGIIVHHAHSPQAKGRVERSNRTHQDRLIKELRLAGITDPEEANEFLPSYMEKHNRKFAVDPTESINAHRSIKGYKLDRIFCIHETRKVQNDYTVLYKKRILQLTDKRNIKYRPKDVVTIKESFEGLLIVSIRGYELEHKELLERPKKPVKDKVYNNQKPKPPSKASKGWNDGIWKKKPYYPQPRIN